MLLSCLIFKDPPSLGQSSGELRVLGLCEDMKGRHFRMSMLLTVRMARGCIETKRIRMIYDLHLHIY